MRGVELLQCAEALRRHLTLAEMDDVTQSPHARAWVRIRSFCQDHSGNPRYGAQERLRGKNTQCGQRGVEVFLRVNMQKHGAGTDA